MVVVSIQDALTWQDVAECRCTVRSAAQTETTRAAGPIRPRRLRIYRRSRRKLSGGTRQVVTCCRCQCDGEAVDFAVHVLSRIK